MQLIQTDKRYVLISKYEERDVPREGGFRWDGSRKQWWTDSREKAAKFARFADPSLKSELEALSSKDAQLRVETAVASRSVDADIDLPSPAGLAYIGYQKAGIAFAMARPNTLIGDDMGLGKTIQAIGIFNADPSIHLAMVIAPASLKLNWRKEILKWTCRPGRILILDGTKGLTAKESQGLKCLSALNAEIRSKGAQKRDNVASGVHVPSELGFLPEPGGMSSVSEPTELRDPIHQSPIGIVDTHTPTGVTAPRSTDTSLPVHDASEVGQISDIDRRDKGPGDPLLIDAASQPFAQAPQFTDGDTVLSANGRVGLAGGDTPRSGEHLGDSQSGPPGTTDRLDRQVERLKAILQGRLVPSDFNGGLAQCDLPTLYALRDYVRLVFRHSACFHPDLRWLIINYDIVKAWRESIDAFGQIDLLIIDECQALKNSKAQRTKAVLGGGKRGPDRVEPIKAARRVFLTGTPILNRPAELWTLVHSLDPRGLGSDFWGFHKRYCGAVNNGYGWDFSGASNLAELQTKLRETIMIRRLKADVLTELPPKRRQLITLSANGDGSAVTIERSTYEAAQDRIETLQAKVALADAADDRVAYEAAVADLRAARSVLFAEMSKLRHATAVAKIPYVIDHLRDAIEASGKVICFAHHIDVVKAIAAEFGNQAVVVTGQTAIVDRQAAVDRFQTDGSCKLFVGNILAAGVGITLTAASHVVFAELDWRPGIVTQAEDRAHRIGQVNSVLVQHLVFDESLDAIMVQRIIEKQDVIDQALDREVGPIEEEDEAAFIASEEPVKDVPKDTKPVPQMTSDQIIAVHAGLRALAAVDADGARALNGIGFNKMDTIIGRDLANCARLTVKQAALGRKICRKYRRQIGDEVVEAMGAS